MIRRIDTEKIEYYISANGYSKTAFAKKCKISYTVLAKILNDNDNFSIVAIFKVAREMKLQMKDLFL